MSKSGFKSIEKSNGQLKHQKSHIPFDASKNYSDYSIHSYSKKAYYEWATEMLIMTSFKCARDKKAWTLHAQGLSGTKIAHKMGYLNRKWINRVLQKIRKYLKE